MDIELKKIKVRDLIKGYVDNDEQGVKAFDGNLNVRPAYQREFVYKDKQRDAVIDTLMKGFPLNTMYWVVGEDGKLEVLDGQQRAISICHMDQSSDKPHFTESLCSSIISRAISQHSPYTDLSSSSVYVQMLLG